MTETQPSNSTNRWTKRTFLGVPLIGWLVLAVAGSVLAAGAYWVTLDATGQITVADGISVEMTGWDTVSNTGDHGTCEAIPLGAGVGIQATGLLPGEYCAVNVTVRNNGGVGANQAAAFQGFVPNLTGGISTQSVDVWADDTTKLNYCGTEIAPGGTAVVGMQIDIGPAASPGDSYDLVSGDGFVFVRADQYDPLGCG